MNEATGKTSGAITINDAAQIFSLQDRFRGCLLGLACGDAVGTAVEFRTRGSFAPLTDMIGGGPFGLEPGQWTDDTSMALCLAQSLLDKGGFDANDQMTRYLAWWQTGYMSSTGECFDIGATVRQALMSYQQTGNPFVGSADPYSAGNGSLMRLAPVALFFYPDIELVSKFSAESSRTTHAAPEAVECCMLFGEMLANVLQGQPKTSLLNMDGAKFKEPKVAELASGRYKEKSRAEIFGTGYSVACLEAALWCFHHTDNFESAVLEAANLGDDADTTAAIVGQLAGAYYGVSGIPPNWLDKLHQRDEMETIADALFRVSTNRQHSCQTGASNKVPEIMDETQFQQLQQILGDLTPAQRERIVERCSDEEPYDFENLIELDNRSIQLALREIQSDTLVIALLPASMALRNKILSNLSSAAAQMLAEDIEARGPVPVAAIQAAQQEIIGIALQKFQQEIAPYIEARSDFQRIYYRLENLSANERLFVSAALARIEADSAAENEMIFDDLESLDEVDLKCLLDHVPDAWLADALKSCPDSLRQKFLLNMPADRAAALREALAVPGQIPVLRCADAQEKVINAAYRLIAEGKIRHAKA